MTGRTIDEISWDLSKLKSFGVDMVIPAINAEYIYDVNETIELLKKSSTYRYKILFFHQ